MKTLYLIRHSKSSWKNTGLSDHDRPFNKRGKRDAPMMAKVLKKRGVIPDLILSSTAVRAYEFARIIAEETGYKEKDISRRKDIYLADESVMLGILKKVEDKYGVVFLIGHNPDLTYFANRLCNYNLDNIPTSGIVGIEFNTDKWSDVDYGRGIFKSFDYPKKYI